MLMSGSMFPKGSNRASENPPAYYHDDGETFITSICLLPGGRHDETQNEKEDVLSLDDKINVVYSGLSPQSRKNHQINGERRPHTHTHFIGNGGVRSLVTPTSKICVRHLEVNVFLAAHASCSGGRYNVCL